MIVIAAKLTVRKFRCSANNSNKHDRTRTTGDRRWNTALTGPKQHGKLVKHLVHEVYCCQVPSTQDYQTAEIYTYKIQYQWDPASGSRSLSLPCVEFTADLTWRTHISNMTGKANRILNLLPKHSPSTSLYMSATKKENLEPSHHLSGHILNTRHRSGTLILSKTFWPLKKSNERVPA